ncbi:MAG TPA: isoamylase early set domain-containing protein [Acidimicrobiales bacterium]|nr:isoamylase early set domain-containing protein [Acidimicrobiales bacterium]
MITTLSRTADDRVKVRFSLPDDGRTVSVVGCFNGWDPHSHPLRKRSNGTRSTAVELPPGTYHFRYLAEGGTWDNEPEAPRLGDDNVIDLR